MIRIPAGEVETSEDRENGILRKWLLVEKEFWLSDCEVTVAQFLEFIEDAQYTFDKPDKPNEIVEYNVGDPLQPAIGINWYDAILSALHRLLALTNRVIKAIDGGLVLLPLSF